MDGDYVPRICQAGEAVFVEDDRAGEAFLIRSGRVRIHKLENGADKEIDTIGAGQIFGEMGVLSDMNRMASATAVEETTLVCCHRRELVRRLEELSVDRRDAFRFLIVYCQDLLPFEMMTERPDDEDTRDRDKIAYYLVRDAERPGELDGLDPFMGGLYKLLISYAKRRLPPGFSA